MSDQSIPDDRPVTDVYDTAQQHLGDVYAKALMGAAEQAGTTDRVMEELESLVSDVLVRVPKLADALSSPRITHEEKEKLLDTAFAGKMSGELLNFLKVASRHGRLNCLEAIRRAARDRYNKMKGRIEVQVRASYPLTDELRESVKATLEKALSAEVILQVEIDESLLGGLVIQIGDTVFDGSVASQLSQLRGAGLSGALQAIRQSTSRFVEQGNESSGSA